MLTPPLPLEVGQWVEAAEPHRCCRIRRARCRPLLRGPPLRRRPHCGSRKLRRLRRSSARPAPWTSPIPTGSSPFGRRRCGESSMLQAPARSAGLACLGARYCRHSPRVHGAWRPTDRSPSLRDRGQGIQVASGSVGTMRAWMRPRQGSAPLTQPEELSPHDEALGRGRVSEDGRAGHRDPRLDGARGVAVGGARPAPSTSVRPAARRFAPRRRRRSGTPKGRPSGRRSAPDPGRRSGGGRRRSGSSCVSGRRRTSGWTRPSPSTSPGYRSTTSRPSFDGTAPRRSTTCCFTSGWAGSASPTSPSGHCRA